MSLRSILSKVDISALEDDIDTLLARLTAARAALIDEITALRLAELDSGNLPTDVISRLSLAHFDITEFEKAQVPPAENAAVNLDTTDETSLGAKDITLDIPSGASIISVVAAARLSIMNNAATAQKIDLKLKVEGVTLFNQTDVVGFGAVDGASTFYIIAEDATDEVTVDGQVVTLEALATLSAAASVRFQAQYYLFITYKMG